MILAELNFDMHLLYMGCAAVGGAILTLQMILLLFGGDASDFDADGDVEFDGDDGSFGLLSVRTVAAFLTFFGLTGLYGLVEGWGAALSLAAAVGAGFAMMLLVAVLMAQFKKLNSSGNVHLENAVGKGATVYLRIPGERSGQGKITVSLQGRSLQYNAVTPGPELATGASVEIVRLTGDGLCEVVGAR